MTNGRGSEFLTFRLTRSPHPMKIRRITEVGIRIPVSGPLAVKRFHVEIPFSDQQLSEEETTERQSERESLLWQRASPDFFMVSAKPGIHPLETFRLPTPIEVKLVRLVFTQNMRGHVEEEADAIGLWEVQFR